MASLPTELVLEIAKYMGIEERIKLAKAFNLPTNTFIGKLGDTGDFEALFVKSRARNKDDFRFVWAGPYVMMGHRFPNKFIVDGIEHVFIYCYDRPGVWLEQYHDNLEDVFKYRYFSQQNQTSTQLCNSVDPRALMVGSQIFRD